MIENKNLSELVLIKKCLKKDRRAQQELFNKYKDAMFTLAYRITGNHDDACDVLQNSFVNIFMKLESFKGNSSLGAWIKTIIVRNAVKKNKTKFTYEDIENVFEQSSLNIDEDLTGQAIEKAILNLDKGYRTVFLLVEVEGYKHKEVAEILNITEGTSKSQLFNAKKHLRKQLQNIYF